MKRMAVALSLVAVFAAGVGFTTRGYAISDERSVGSPLTLSAVRPSVAPGGRVDVDVVVSNVADLRVYQLQLQAKGGARGELTLEGITIDKQRPDFVFGADMVIDAVDMVGLRAGAVRFDGGVKVEQAVYLATFHFRASTNAKGTFRINVLEGEESFLADSLSRKIALGAPDDLEVMVAVGAKAPQRPRETRPR